MISKPAIISFCLLLCMFAARSQNSTFSPYSRYGMGEMASSVLSHNAGMGGAHIALKPDSSAPIFINTGNPAAYSMIKLTTLEVGGRFQYTTFKNSSSSIKKWGTNFSYATLGFPIRNNGGACFGIKPYSYVGYETQTSSSQDNIGTVTANYQGSGGLNNAFIGYGVMPFIKRLNKFRQKHLSIHDSLKTLSKPAYKFREFNSKLLSDLSLGFNVNYIFGSNENITRIIYPNSLLYNNSFRERTVTLGAFTGNFGLQTAATVDSITDRKGRHAHINQLMKTFRELNVFTEQELEYKKDSLAKYTPLHKRMLRERIKFTFGYFMALNNKLNATYNSAGYNYILNGSGQEILRDTAYKSFNNKSSITLPLEQGFGIGIKKGERLNLVADFAITNWSNFKYLSEANTFKDNYRVAIGLNYVPEKYASGRNSFYKRINYRMGASYNTGYLKVNNTMLDNYNVSLGLGIPVGANRYVSSMVNMSLIYGQMGTNAGGLIKENYWRINFGFTFSDRWFQKFRYD